MGLFVQRPKGAYTRQAFPVGAVFISVVATDPATLLGYGTWSAFGTGRVMVGYDSNDTDFDVAEETGGAKTVTSTGSVAAASDHAAHVHSGPADHASHTHDNHGFTQPNAHGDVLNHVHTLATGTGATGNFSQVLGTVDASSGGTGGTPTQTALGTLSGNPTANGVASQTHTGGAVTPTTHSADSGTAISHGNTGNNTTTLTHNAPAYTGNATSVVQPYIVVFMWKRTA